MRKLFLSIPGCPTLRGFRRVGGTQVTTKGRIPIKRHSFSVLAIVLTSVLASAQQIQFRDITAQAGIASTPDLSLLIAHLARPVLKVENPKEFLAPLPIETLTMIAT